MSEKIFKIMNPFPKKSIFLFPEKVQTFKDYHPQKLSFTKNQSFNLSYYYLIVNINMVVRNLIFKNDT